MDTFSPGAAVGVLLVLLILSTFFLRRTLRAPSDKSHRDGTPDTKLQKDILLQVPELKETTVEDIMVPRSEIAGIDLDSPWNVILEQLQNSQYARMPVYAETIDNVLGVLHLRKALAEASRESLTKDRLRDLMQEPYFIPEATPLHRQLPSFRESRQRIGLVVDEYGDILGLITLEDILEEIVGELTTKFQYAGRDDITPESEGSFLVSGGIPIRTLNRALNWNLPTDGPKTLNGLILETIEAIPLPNTGVRVAGHPMEVVQSSRNVVKLVRVRPREDREDNDGSEESVPKTGEFTD
ncbi:MAG TPA: transporter associated domain-containing protein [Gammaproteobacteria bacterium]